MNALKNAEQPSHSSLCNGYLQHSHTTSQASLQLTSLFLKTEILRWCKIFLPENSWNLGRFVYKWLAWYHFLNIVFFNTHTHTHTYKHTRTHAHTQSITKQWQNWWKLLVSYMFISSLLFKQHHNISSLTFKNVSKLVFLLHCYP
jgi:hypothetical protein